MNAQTPRAADTNARILLVLMWREHVVRGSEPVPDRCGEPQGRIIGVVKKLPDHENNVILLVWARISNQLLGERRPDNW